MKKEYIRKILFTIVISFCVSTLMAQHRVIILTDVENEPDDTESLVRLMLYSNEIDIKGIVATNSTHMRDRVVPETIHKVIDAYAQVRDNLLLHAKGYPEADYLHSIVKKGSTLYGMKGVGEGKNSEGSNWIIQELQRDDERPLWVCAWGGVNVLAQALFQMKSTKSAKEMQWLLKKLRVYTISDQDDTGIDNEVISNRWLAENIQQGHGPLGACYPDVAYGMEGDTPSWLSLIPNGLNAPEHPNWGGWGGRYEYFKPNREDCDLNGFTGNVPIEDEPHAIWTNAIDHFRPFIASDYGCAVKRSEQECSGYTATVWRWRTDFQNDFAARMDWCVKPKDDANHPPVVVVDCANEIRVKSGEHFVIEAEKSYDPDGDSVSYLWFCYPEAGCGKMIEVEGSPNIHKAGFRAPKVCKAEDYHIILRVTDKGTPSLSRYQRIVVHVY